MTNELISTTKIAVFRKKKIRKTIHNNKWWFVIKDVVAALMDSAQPDGYIKDMRRRDAELAKGWGQIATPLSVQTAGGIQKLNCANTELSSYWDTICTPLEFNAPDDKKNK